MSRQAVEIISAAGYVLDLTVLGAMFTMEEKLDRIQGRLTAGIMLKEVIRESRG